MEIAPGESSHSHLYECAFPTTHTRWSCDRYCTYIKLQLAIYMVCLGQWIFSSLFKCTMIKLFTLTVKWRQTEGKRQKGQTCDRFRSRGAIWKAYRHTDLSGLLPQSLPPTHI